MKVSWLCRHGFHDWQITLGRTHRSCRRDCRVHQVAVSLRFIQFGRVQYVNVWADDNGGEVASACQGSGNYHHVRELGDL